MKKFLFFCLVLGAIIYACGNNTTNVKDDVVSNVSDSIDNDAEKDSSIDTWFYDSKTDEMNDTKTYYANLTSTNFVEQDFPYGSTNARITIRHTKKYGNEAIIMIASGQIHGNEYNNSNYVEVRFDNLPPKKYTFTETESGSSDAVFIDRENDFINNCKKAKEIKIKIPFFQEGRLLFTFSADKPLVWNH